MMKLLFHGIGHYSDQDFGTDGWPHYDLLIMKQGHIHFQTKQGSLQIKANDALLIPPGCSFQGYPKNILSVIWVTHFKRTPDKKLRTLLKKERQKVGIYFFPQGAGSALAISLMQRLDEIYHGESRWPPFAEGYFDALLSEILASIDTIRDSKKQWINDLRSWSKKHLHQSIGIRELAAHTKLSESHFRKLFLKRSGKSAGRFLFELRMEEAKEFLLKSDFNIKEISARVGYSDPVAFHHAFAQYTKASPTQFRRGKHQIV